MRPVRRLLVPARSDVRLAKALNDRASFRRFCGFSTYRSTPGRTAFVRFRAELIRLGLDRTLFDRALFAAVTRQIRVTGPKELSVPEAVGRALCIRAGSAGQDRQRLLLRNAEISRVRYRIGTVSGTATQSHGLRPMWCLGDVVSGRCGGWEMWWLGVAKAGLRVQLSAMAYHLRRSMTLLVPTTT